MNERLVKCSINELREMCGVKAFIVLFVVAKDTHLRRRLILCLAA